MLQQVGIHSSCTAAAVCASAGLTARRPITRVPCRPAPRALENRACRIGSFVIKEICSSVTHPRSRAPARFCLASLTGPHGLRNEQKDDLCSHISTGNANHLPSRIGIATVAWLIQLRGIGIGFRSGSNEAARAPNAACPVTCSRNATASGRPLAGMLHSRFASLCDLSPWRSGEGQDGRLRPVSVTHRPGRA